MKNINKKLERKRKVYVTRKVHFSASHRLFNPNFSDEENEKIFDRCDNIHGHNYDLYVTLFGEVNKEKGYLFDLKILKQILEKEILEKVDHKYLNLDVEMFKDTVPTAEVIAITFWDILQRKIELLELKHLKLFEVKIYETERNIVIYRGE